MADELDDRNVGALDGGLAPDYVHHAVDQGKRELNREEYQELNAGNREEHDNWTLTVRDLCVNGDEILERTQLTGTYSEEEETII